MRIPFPAASLSNTQRPFPSTCWSTHPGCATSRQPSGTLGLPREEDIPEKEKSVGFSLLPLFPNCQGGCTFAFVRWMESSGCDTSSPRGLMRGKRSWAICLGHTRALGHSVVCWGVLGRCCIFSLAFVTKRKL